MTAQQAFPDPATAAWVSAVWDKNYKEADRWLAQGAKVNLIGTDGITPMLWIMGAGTWKVDRLEYMLKAGADPNQRSPKFNVSPMFYAASSDKPDVLELFLKHHGDPNLIGDSPDDEPMLFAATRNSRLENMKILLRAGADINRLNRFGQSVARGAIIRTRYDQVVYLLSYGLSAGLYELALDCDDDYINPKSEQNQWRKQAIDILEQRGVVFPIAVQSMGLDSELYPIRKEQIEFIQKGTIAFRQGNYQTAINCYQRLASDGFPGAMIKLGAWFHGGVTGVQDFATARSWYIRALARDHGDAWNNLGVMYEKGQGVGRDPQLAWACFTVAQIKQGSGTTQMRAKLHAERVGPLLTQAQRAEAEGWTVEYVRARLEAPDGSNPDPLTFEPSLQNPKLSQLVSEVESH